ncbi:diguanylate cyclase [Evansella tamaricis]|uniref:Diguanylate cyclase n=1 Tax=Evansella tamaricis TaxID=2069301 RepID=A0ABS6JHC3_9BACI|nr:diguanylate cyclase [Evansella tamaricis]MBU9711743.1 diguanylate cyclase [Evansella tamaricis]
MKDNSAALLKNPFNVYIIIISIIGCSTVFIHESLSFELKMNDWTIIAVLIIAVIILNEYMIMLPPKGNSLSLDSAIYIASMFIFGIEITLYVLIISSIIFALYHRKIVWWKHLFNFATYSIMINSSFLTFIYIGGQVGSFDVAFLPSYMLALVSYFAANVLLVGIYFLLSVSEGLFTIFKGILKDALSSYLITLALAFILTILLESNPVFGLVVFTIVIILLSLVFRQYFHLYEEVSNKANIDYLTGLYNHGFFKESLEQHFKSQEDQRLSLAVLDLDDFKKYNDHYGHLQGDELLKYFGTILKTNCEEKNFIVARYGGEEFSILMPETSINYAYQFMDELRKKVNDTYFKGVEILPQGCLSFSGGIIERDKSMLKASEFLGKADKAMYYAKAQGKNNIHLFDENDQNQKTLDDEKELEHLEQQLRIFLYKDVNTYKHSRRVYQYAIHFSKKLNLNEQDKKLIIMGALIHDIGKLEIPRDILNKKGKLDALEWDMVKKHVIWGKEIISTNKDLEDLIPLVELHHERFDGKGYPYGLKGRSIPKLARILCIIDSFDAMTTERPYQNTKTFNEAVEELMACSNQQFDPDYVIPFIEMIKEIYPMKFKEPPYNDTKISS